MASGKAQCIPSSVLTSLLVKEGKGLRQRGECGGVLGLVHARDGPARAPHRTHIDAPLQRAVVGGARSGYRLREKLTNNIRLLARCKHKRERYIGFFKKNTDGKKYCVLMVTKKKKEVAHHIRVPRRARDWPSCAWGRAPPAAGP